MEAKINIAEILKDKPVELKLYSSTFGYIKFNGVHKNKVYFSSEDTNVHSVKSNGKMYDSGECIIFPSKEMRDWNKFAWKKGDVLMSDNGKVEVIFEKFVDDTYQSFIGKHHLDNLEDNLYYQNEGEYLTNIFNTESKDAAQTYVKTLEKKLGGKLNRETLEVEKVQPEFKDGDILSCDEDSYTRRTTLILHKDKNITESIVSLIRHKELVENAPINNFLLSRLYHAREDEKKELFDALAKKNKAWDAEKKQIVDLKEYPFKPFEKVLVRDSYDDVWRASFFSHIKENDGRYVTTCVTWKFCIPYEGNEHLLGTTNNVEE